MRLLPRTYGARADAARLFAFAAAIVLAGCSAAHRDLTPPSANAVEAHASVQGEAPQSLARLDVKEIRYSQASYSVTGDTEDGHPYSVQDNAKWLREHPGEDLPWGGPIRIFRKEAFMDNWGPLARDSNVGDPVNLENGETTRWTTGGWLPTGRRGGTRLPWNGRTSGWEQE